MTGAAPEVPAQVTGEPELIVHPDEGGLAAVTAGRLIAAILDAQSARGQASVVLTGGEIGIGVLAAVATAPGKDAVDWSAVDLWWGDERWVADDDGERNDRQAREALLDALPLTDSRVHPMAGSDTTGTPEESAAAYVAEVGDAPEFDVTMLGIGPEGHVASMFPASPAIREHALLVVGVHDCPKPPPERVSMTLPLLNRSRQVWIIASGDSKAAAIAKVVAGTDADEVPAAGVHGRERTLVLVDRAAASEVTGRS